MTHQITRIELEATSIGTSRHLVVHRFGEVGRGPHVYVQASLHADEAPAMLVAHHLVRMLKSRARDFKGSATIVPYANPIGLSQRMLALHAGRGDLGVGGNFNRRFADLSAALRSRLAGHAKERPESLRQITRNTLLELAAALPAPDELSGLRKTLLQLALEADYVLDLHTHYEGTVYMYTNVTDPVASDELGRLSQCRVVLHDQGAVAMPGQLSLDQACDLAWRSAGEFGVPHGCFTATLEYRGQTETSDALAEADAAALVQFMIRRGVLSGTPEPLPEPLCEPTPVDAVAHLQAPRPGIIIHRCAPGDRVAKGDVVAEVVDPAADPDVARVSVLAPCDGVVIGRPISRIARPGLVLASIAANSVDVVPPYSGDPYP